LSIGRGTRTVEAVRQPTLHPDAFGPPAPRIDDLDVSALAERSTYEVRTDDGWTLVVTRFRPLDQPFAQPIRGEPMLLVHGFCQNRHAWTCGGFVKHMLFYGADLHVLELRGHGRSSVRLQHDRARRAGRRPPADVDYGWDIDSYFLQDVPAAVAAVKRLTGRETIFYCGHSLGGMLGYGYAALTRELAGLVTVGAPCDPGRGYLPLRLLAHVGPQLEAAVDAALAFAHLGDLAGWRARSILRGARGAAAIRAAALARPVRRHFRYYPFDTVLRRLERALAHPRAYEAWSRVARHYAFLANPARLTLDEIRWLLREGGEREPRGVVAQLARWVRRGELKCYRTGDDFRDHFGDIDIPMAIIFGDRDPLAGIASTQAIYRAARSEYLLWRPVKGNSHLELTMGRDIRQICFDVKNLVEFARKFPPAREGEPAKRDAARAEAARREVRRRIDVAWQETRGADGARRDGAASPEPRPDAIDVPVP
jgi:pimeloyl-ACP methyl ester carboxylesterase